MGRYLAQSSNLMKKWMLTIFLILMGIAVFLGITNQKEYFVAFLAAIFCVLLFFKTVLLVAQRTVHLGALKIWIALTIICVVIKGIWILKVRVPIAGDYSVFWGYAQSLATHNTIYGGRYMALFPHIFGYSSFLSWFVKVWGTSPMLGPVLNLLLTICSGSIIFRLCMRWFNLTAGAVGYLLWILCPSQTIYNSLTLSEPLYTTLILAVLLVLTEAEVCTVLRSYPLFLAPAVGISCGVILRLVNGVRPIAAVLVIALLIWVALLNTGKLLMHKWRWWWSLCIVCLLSTYFILGPIWNQHIAERIGEEPSQTPGYSFLVGFNPESSGRWNQEDSDRLYYYSDQPGATAQWTQEQLLAEAEERISSGEIDFALLFIQKLRTFLGSDDTCVGYSSAVLRHTTLFSFLCNTFYYTAVLLAIVGAIKLWKREQNYLTLLAPLYVIGLTCAQMLVEVAGRYHYSILPMLLMIGAGVAGGEVSNKSPQNQSECQALE